MIDAHIHIQALSPEGILNAKKVGISGWLANSAKISDWAEGEAVALRYPEVVPFFGLHPWYSSEKSPDFEKTLTGYLEKYPKAGVGEIGLDKLKPWEGQEDLFQEQLEIAASYRRVVSLHSVKASEEVLAALLVYKDRLAGIILHAFTGPIHLLPKFAEIGAYFSISPFLFKKNPDMQKQILKAIPDDRLLIETDAPDGAKPDYLPEVAETAALLLSRPWEEIAKLTAENARRLINHE